MVYMWLMGIFRFKVFSNPWFKAEMQSNPSVLGLEFTLDNSSSMNEFSVLRCNQTRLLGLVKVKL